MLVLAMLGANDVMAKRKKQPMDTLKKLVEEFEKLYEKMDQAVTKDELSTKLVDFRAVIDGMLAEFREEFADLTPDEIAKLKDDLKELSERLTLFGNKLYALETGMDNVVALIPQMAVMKDKLGAMESAGAFLQKDIEALEKTVEEHTALLSDASMTGDTVYFEALEGESGTGSSSFPIAAGATLPDKIKEFQDKGYTRFFLYGGTYRINKPIVLKANNRLIGVDPLLVKLVQQHPDTLAQDTRVMTVESDYSHFPKRVQSLTIDCNGEAAPAGTVSHAVNLRGPECLIENVHVTNAANKSLSVMEAFVLAIGDSAVGLTDTRIAYCRYFGPFWGGTSRRQVTFALIASNFGNKNLNPVIEHCLFVPEGFNNCYGNAYSLSNHTDGIVRFCVARAPHKTGNKGSWYLYYQDTYNSNGTYIHNNVGTGVHSGVYIVTDGKNPDGSPQVHKRIFIQDNCFSLHWAENSGNWPWAAIHLNTIHQAEYPKNTIDKVFISNNVLDLFTPGIPETDANGQPSFIQGAILLVPNRKEMHMDTFVLNENFVDPRMPMVIE